MLLVIGNTVTMNSKYSDLILKAGKTSAVSSYHLASRIKQEGPFFISCINFRNCKVDIKDYIISII